MVIQFDKLVDGTHQIVLDESPDALALPTDEGGFVTPVHVDATLLKTGDNLVLHATVSTDVNFECSRCLTPMSEHLSGEFSVLYRKTEFGELPVVTPESDVADDVEMLEYEAEALDISARVEEAIRLEMPMKPLCRDDCQGLCPICGVDRNREDCGCQVLHEDSRLQALKTLLQ